MKDCVFCQIARGKVPCWKINENSDYLAFLDISYFTEGHTLVIPKKHYRWVWDVPNVGGYFNVAGQIVNHYRKTTGGEFVASVVWGQMIPHAHIQILPWPEKLDLSWKRTKLTEEKAKELVKKLAIK